jgi:predicted PurR-regulated permease PerM
MTSQSGWTRTRILFLTVSAALLLVIILWAQEVILPFIMAGIVAYVLTPMVAAMERRGMQSGAAVLLIYFLLGTAMYFATVLTVPRLQAEVTRLSDELPHIGKQISEEWGPTVQKQLSRFEGVLKKNAPADAPVRPLIESAETTDGKAGWELTQPVDFVQVNANHWQVRPVAGPKSLHWPDLLQQGVQQTVDYARRNVGQLASFLTSLVGTTSRAIFLFFMTLMCAAYIIITRQQIFGFIRDLCPPTSHASFERLLTRLDLGLSGVVRGQLLICVVNGVLTAIGFAMFDLKYWGVLSILAGVFSIIPIFGSILSTIPAVAVGLTQDIWTATWVLLWILGIHQVEANLLNPKIMGVSAKLHPVLVVFALVLGEHQFQLWGALLAVPALSVCQNLFHHVRAEFLGPPPAPEEQPPPSEPTLPPSSELSQ